MRTKELDKISWHRLTKIDYEAKTALCSQCGNTTIVKGERDNKHAKCMFSQIQKGIIKRHIKKYGVTPNYRIKKVTDKTLHCELCEGSQRISFDHDSSTGVFRGWLCIKCNTALGLVNEDIDLLQRMIDYLRGAV